MNMTNELEVPLPRVSVAKDNQATPKCPRCGATMIRTTMFRAWKQGVETQFQVYACFSHREFTSIRKVRGE